MGQTPARERATTRRPKARFVRATTKFVLTDSIKAAPAKLNTAVLGEISQVQEWIVRFRFLDPIIVDAHNRAIAGFDRLVGARLMAVAEVPIFVVRGLSSAQRFLL